MKYQFGSGTVSNILAVLAQIPEFEKAMSVDLIENRLAGKNYLILVAELDNKPVGFKVGYTLSDGQFYSWLGGVVPEHRNMKVASQLRLIQESWAIDNGFKSISVKSMNQFPAMLQMLIASGYQICGYEDNGSITDSKIEFIKFLQTP
ncbi:GNAT family N-acetyltransferase [Shewanella sp. Arc9-LZ]|uniref:GNAT family N-acetyltransferase n=1 Tax=Shewanella sp. Arc9-LZ TaxID=2698686 RepID=UPI00137BF274|nr:GNAT family N-acetyltransferase [Shewanella sp. Arc9-LZ]QHS11676.1 GNAT family N-acetyltransferase [Shewanella sp. Arc9-LZ]